MNNEPFAPAIRTCMKIESLQIKAPGGPVVMKPSPTTGEKFQEKKNETKQNSTFYEKNRNNS